MIFNIGSFFAKNGAQQLFFRGQLCFTFWRHLAHQHVTRFDLGANVADTRLIQTPQLHLGQIGNITRDFFSAELGVTRNHAQFFNMNRGIAVFSHVRWKSGSSPSKL